MAELNIKQIEQVAELSRKYNLKDPDNIMRAFAEFEKLWLLQKQQGIAEKELARSNEEKRIAAMREGEPARMLESDISRAKTAGGFFVPENAGNRLRGGFLGKDFSKESGIYETEAPRPASEENLDPFLGGYSNIGSTARPISPEQQSEVDRLQGIQSGAKSTGKIDLDRIAKARKYETDILKNWDNNPPMVDDVDNKGKKRPATLEEQMVLARKLSDNAFGIGGVKGLEAPRIDVRREARAHEKVPFRTFGDVPKEKGSPLLPDAPKQKVKPVEDKINIISHMVGTGYPRSNEAVKEFIKEHPDKLEELRQALLASQPEPSSPANPQFKKNMEDLLKAQGAVVKGLQGFKQMFQPKSSKQEPKGSKVRIPINREGEMGRPINKAKTPGKITPKGPAAENRIIRPGDKRFTREETKPTKIRQKIEKIAEYLGVSPSEAKAATPSKETISGARRILGDFKEKYGSNPKEWPILAKMTYLKLSKQHPDIEEALREDLQ